MKNLLAVATALLLISTSKSVGQECDKLLEDGLYQKINVLTKTSLNQDIRTYFLSEKFKTDMKEGKWGASLAVPINSVPVSIGANSSDTEFSVFTEKIKKATSFSLSINDLKSISQQLPNEGLYTAYVQCVDITSNKNRTGLIQGQKVENDETVIFSFYYRPASTSERPPKVTSFVVEPKNSLIDAGGLQVGKPIPSFLMSVVCRRSEVNEVTINIQTDAGPINDNSGPTRSSKFETPIGTIISSYLSFDRFREANGEKGVWKKTDKWAPCDGRDVSGSAFAKYSQSTTPDLRGYFLRGLNTFDVNPPAGVERVQRDPAGDRTVGRSQEDALKSHAHSIDTYKGQTGVGRAMRPIEGSDAGGADSHTTNEFGISETRPINIAVYYYVKVN